MITVQNDTHLYTTLTQEEHQAVIDKMQSLVQLPANHLGREDELYLEQQLSEMLGFEVMAEYEHIRLPQSIGTMAALPHLRRHPADTLEAHDTYREAGMGVHRSIFGWFTELGQLTPKAIQREKYYIAVHADFLPGWNDAEAQQKMWWKYRKMIVINPHAHCAVVTAVGDIGPANWLQHQFGGSPEVIREAAIWSLTSQGKVFCLFVNDPEDQVALGPLDLNFKG